jgi:hypothetical protein
MESGIQLAAIVLGVVPIFRRATGNWRMSSRIGHPQSQIGRPDDLEDFLTNLHYELSVLQMAIEKLVNELDCLYLDEKDALKAGSGSNQRLWTDPRVTHAVRDRLGSGYDIFRTQVTKLLEQLEKLVAKDAVFQHSGLESEEVKVSLVFRCIHER